MEARPPSGRTTSCPAWCAVQHGRQSGEEDTVHVSGALMVRGTVLQLCMTHDLGTDTRDGPYVLVGPEEFSLHGDRPRRLSGRRTDLGSAAARLR